MPVLRPARAADPGVGAIVTVPPYADFVAEVAAHPLVVGMRLNTVMPVAGPLEPVLERLGGHGVPLYLDLKGRQLRVVGAAIPPFTEVRVSHRLSCRTPTEVYFNDGQEVGRLVAVEGDRLILEDSPRRVVGPGESVNIVHPSLRIEGTLTETDKRYIAAGRTVGIHDYMLSYVESEADLAEVEALDPQARVVAKIENSRGIDFARQHRGGRARLMVGRGDLYVEVVRPHRLLGCLKELVGLDPDAIVASRLFPSLAHGSVPAAQDITDAAWLLQIGYRTLMLGDEVCLRRDSVLAALNLLEAVAGEVG